MEVDELKECRHGFSKASNDKTGLFGNSNMRVRIYGHFGIKFTI